MKTSYRRSLSFVALQSVKADDVSEATESLHRVTKELLRFVTLRSAVTRTIVAAIARAKRILPPNRPAQDTFEVVFDQP